MSAMPSALAAAISSEDAVADLVSSAKDGDARAWDTLVERYTPLIQSVCRRLQVRGADAEDVSQAVWLRFVEHLDNLREPAALPGWLTTTAQRECWRVLRAPVTVPGDGQWLENMPDERTVTAEHQLLAAERGASLRAAFGRLPPRCQRLLAMLVADPPVPYTEISAQLGIAVGSIGPDRRRSLDRLRRDPAIAMLINADAART